MMIVLGAALITIGFIFGAVVTSRTMRSIQAAWRRQLIDGADALVADAHSKLAEAWKTIRHDLEEKGKALPPLQPQPAVILRAAALIEALRAMRLWELQLPLTNNVYYINIGNDGEARAWRARRVAELEEIARVQDLLK